MNLNHTNKATLILGAGGFLGSKIFDLTLKNGHVFRSIRNNTTSVVDSYGSEIAISQLFKCEFLHVLNCSSGRYQNTEDANSSHFQFPATVLKQILNSDLKVDWTQFDSYTQYTKRRVHDVNYVSAKKTFNEYLSYLKLNHPTLKINRIALPHLYGAGDKINRYLPKTFQKILKSKIVEINSPHELLPVIDVIDCAKIALEISSADQFDIHSRSIKSVSIPPSEIVSVFDFFSSFKVKTNSSCRLIKGQDLDEIFIERWFQSEQPIEFSSSLMRSSREKTFERVIYEMEGLF